MALLITLQRIGRRLVALLRREQRERDMNDEMRFHIEMEARDLERAGIAAGVARRQARIAFGGVECHKEAGRDAWGVRLIEDLGQDLRYAVRQCFSNPSFTLATLVTLSLGIGASTIMYSFTNLTPVPFDGSDRLVYIRQYSKKGCPGCQNVAAGNALALAVRSRALKSMAFMSESQLALRGPERSEVVRAAQVTYEFFNTTHMPTLIGRPFLPSDTISGAAPVALISEALWRTRYGADSAIVGRDIVLEGVHHTVRGVVPKAYVYPERTMVWQPLVLSPAEANEHRSVLNYRTIARLRDGVTVEQAAIEAQTVAERLALDFPEAFRDWTLDVRLLKRYGTYDDDRVEAIFITAVGFVLFISCTNLAGVLIARLTRRRRELAVRAAMGAHASRITRQLLTETLLVCVLAGAVGVGLAHFGLREVVNAVPESAAPAGWTHVNVDWRSFAFAIAAASFAGIAIGFWPSLRFARPDLDVELRDGVRAASKKGMSGSERLRRALVVAELALSLVLLAAAGLLVRTVANMANAPVGFSSDHVLTMSLQLPAEADGKRVESRGYFDRLASEIEQVPGVMRAGAVAALPLSRSGWSATMFQVAGRPALRGSGGTRTQQVTPGYFEALQIPIRRGRAFTEADADTAHRVALVNGTLARKFVDGDDPIGSVLVLFGGMRVTVVGVVGDVKQNGASSDAGSEILMTAATTSRRSMNLVVRTSRDPAEMTTDIVKAVAAYDPSLAINRVRTMDVVVDEFLAPFRVERMLMGGFAVIAIVIATIGLYAIMSYMVASRTREFGVRLALGASGRSLIGLVLGEGLRLAGLGIVIGTAGAVATTRLMASMLFHVQPGDPVTIGAVGLIICLVSLAAGAVPARRAVSVDPVTSLRQD
jgi:predicted permease